MEDFSVNGRGGLPKSHSFATFYSITVAAKHLAVFCDCSATVTPWFYMVSLHFFQLEVFAAMRTNAFLAFISFSFLFFVEGAKTKIA